MTEAKIEKRNRPPKSCEPCRIRKLKCNRELPCDSCIRRDKATICQYAANADRSEKADCAGDRRGANANGKTVSSRLKRLEDMILKMATAPASVPATAQRPERSPDEPKLDQDSSVNTPMSTPVLVDTGPSSELVTPATTAEPLSGGQLDNQHAHYIDASHWSSLLEEIKELREQLVTPTREDEQLTSSVDTGNSITLDWPATEDRFADLVFSGTTQTLAELIEKLPPRLICDRLVSTYFRVGHSVLPILHPIQFQEEYASFWEAPCEAPPLWVALLFGILGVASGLFRMSRQEKSTTIPTPEAMAEASRQCLVLGSYVTVDKYSIEAMMILLQGHYFYVSEGGDGSLHISSSASRLWFLMGMIIRLAIRRGYHRDPSKLPSARLSPFAAEMRRRVWVGISQVDALMSFQLGLPSMIPAADCDTALPRNLEYTDLFPTMPVLPTSRPTSDTTSILYTIVKAGIMTRFKTVVGHTRALAPRPYNETMALDASLRQAYSDLPVTFKYKPLSQSLIDSAAIIMNRITIEMLYLKSLIVLHRAYLTAARHRDEAQRALYATSREACLTAACTVLHRQVELAQAAREGGLLHDSQWMISALTINDFILATLVICLDVTLGVKHGEFQRQHFGSRGIGGVLAERCMAAIEQSHPVWKAWSPGSPEARIATDAIDAAIQRVEAVQQQPMGAQTQNSSLSASPMEQDTQDSMAAITATDDANDIDFINWHIGIMAGRDAAKKIVDEMAKKNGYIRPDLMARMEASLSKEDIDDFLEIMGNLRRRAAASVKTLAQNLYSSSAKFVFELLQNYDDNIYSESGGPPSVSFRIYPDRIVASCNEAGFTAENVKAICSIGQSSKKQTQAQIEGHTGYAGEKGIGFKSVFMAAEGVHIQSGDYSFRFEYKNGDSGLGMTTPIWTDRDESLDVQLSHITLTLRSDGEPGDTRRRQDIIHEQFHNIHDSILLFMKKLQRLQVSFYNEAETLVSTTIFTVNRQPDRTTVKKAKTTFVAGGEETTSEAVKHYVMVKHVVKNLARNENRRDLDGEVQAANSNGVVVLGFPIDANSVPVLKDEYIFAFLPIKQMGFKVRPSVKRRRPFH
ncbi:hypothetical protein SBRCBS47491_003363 [Sporothrix bragantina]|uniref:Zn(2)-C6 fungal-type domain-containing protein n=1 Tax=Sporothrix bragantina TaxID=671064 RepID=A0ABP0BFR1_9PEZI